MKIKSAKSFRHWYKNLTPARKQAPQYWDENFIGAQYEDISGFFTMYHGDKVEVYDFLRKEVEMAEDGQAIYEFVQNAADSDSTKFYMFYDENYLIVINNGNVFTKEGIKSILNIGQSYGKQDPDKIGRYGIGFKLVHRLVGKSSGLDELLNVDKLGYRGPILFSWSEKSQFSKFLKSKEFEYVDFEDEDAPWLLKILITNFPTQPTEKIKDLDFTEIEPFEEKELENFQAFLNSNIDRINLNTQESGTIFFLKLGDGKSEYLEKQKKEYLNGLTTSMHFLKSLDTLVVNELTVSKDKKAANVIDFTVRKGSEDFNKIGLTEARDKESDVKFKLCFADNPESAIELRKHPNIYKYFPAVKEVNYLSFVIHCNLFELSSNRQNLTETPINKNLLWLLANQVITKMEYCKSADRKTFNNLFISILLSEEPSSTSSGNGWQKEYFYNILTNYIRNAIPNKANSFSDNPKNVKISKTKLNRDLSDFGLNNIQWFEWNEQVDSIIVDQAIKPEKLGIEKWDIRDIVENANLQAINKWISEIDDKVYTEFLEELAQSDLRIETRKKLCSVKLFKFSDEKKYSLYEITGFIINRFDGNTGNYRFYKSGEQKPDFLFHTSKTQKIDAELKKLAFKLCDYKIAKYLKVFFNDNWNVYSFHEIQSEKSVYHRIAERCRKYLLSTIEKKNLFLNFINEETKFDNIGESTIEQIQLFSNRNSEIGPLNYIIGNIKTPKWLNPFKIKEEEYFPELDSFLITKSTDIFDYIYQDNKDDINAELSTFEEIEPLIELYKEKDKSFFKEYIIIKEKNRFTIEEKIKGTYQVHTTDSKTKEFIDKYLCEELIILPDEFSKKYKDEIGIIKNDDLQILILELVDIDEHKNNLIDFVKNKACHKFLETLSEIRINPECKYNKEDFEYKILKLACRELNEIDIIKLRRKLVIETKEQDFDLSEIPPVIPNFKIEGKELELSKILPNNYKNSDYINLLLNQFFELGLEKAALKKLFGLGSEIKPSDIFKLFFEQVELLENAEQLAFLFLYGLHIEEIDFSQFKVENINGEEVSLDCDKYLTEISFIDKTEVLHPKYKGITSFFSKFPIQIEYHDNLLLIKEPYFENDLFVCPCIKDNLTENEKSDFMDFLFNQWNKKNRKTAIRNINWSRINNIPTENVLGFNPVYAVHPGKYALPSENLPKYISKWIGKDNARMDFLTDLGVWTGNSVIADVRKFLSGVSKDFNHNRLSQEIRFNDNELTLFNTFLWLKENSIKINSKNHLDCFKKIVSVINDSRLKRGDLIVEDNFDFNLLKENSLDWDDLYYRNWKKNHPTSIFLFDGEMPKNISLDEIDEYVFCSYCENNIAIDSEKNIFINRNGDIKKELTRLELENEDFNFSELWQIKSDLLELENTQLKNIKTENSESRDDELDNPFEDITAEDEIYIRSIIGGVFDLNEQLDANTTAKIKTLLAIRGLYSVSEISDEGRYLKAGSDEIIVRSAQKGILFLDVFHWGRLKEPGVCLSVYTNNQIHIFKTQEELISFSKPQNKFGIVRMPKDYDLEDYNSLDCISDKGKWHYVLIVNENTHTARNYKEVMNLDDYDF